MADTVSLRINGKQLSVAAGTVLAAAVLDSGASLFRKSVSGEARGPVCGMGICYECRVTVDGIPHQRACMIACAEGMEVETDA